MRVSEGKGCRLGRGLFSGTVGIIRPPWYKHEVFLRIASLKLCRATHLLLNSEIFEMEFIIRTGNLAAPDANVDVLLKPDAFLRSGFPLFTVKAYLANHIHEFCEEYLFNGNITIVIFFS